MHMNSRYYVLLEIAKVQYILSFLLFNQWNSQVLIYDLFNLWEFFLYSGASKALSVTTTSFPITSLNPKI